MDDWIQIQLKKYAPVYKAAVANFNRFGYKRLIALREATDPQNKNFNGKMSQRSLSAIADILPQNYNKIERGRINNGNNITLEQAIKISIIYGCSIDYIATGKIGEIKGDANKVIDDLHTQLNTERKLNKMLTEENEKLKSKKK
jgi:transcriptional regulator with XRE-family HTH domain